MLHKCTCIIIQRLLEGRINCFFLWCSLALGYSCHTFLFLFQDWKWKLSLPGHQVTITGLHAVAYRAMCSSLFIYEQLMVFFSKSQRFSVGLSLYTQHLSVTAWVIKINSLNMFRNFFCWIEASFFQSLIVLMQSCSPQEKKGNHIQNMLYLLAKEVYTLFFLSVSNITLWIF